MKEEKKNKIFMAHMLQSFGERKKTGNPTPPKTKQ